MIISCVCFWMSLVQKNGYQKNTNNLGLPDPPSFRTKRQLQQIKGLQKWSMQCYTSSRRYWVIKVIWRKGDRLCSLGLMLFGGFELLTTVHLVPNYGHGYKQLIGNAHDQWLFNWWLIWRNLRNCPKHINGQVQFQVQVQVQLTQLPRSCQRPTQHTFERGRACNQKD